jgi:hyperosmotically inducible protein
MNRNLFRMRTIGPMLAAMALLAGSVGFAQARHDQKFSQNLNREVHHQLVMVPWFSVFDNLEYSINGSEVTLTGQVMNSSVKEDAGSYVKSIEGVTAVHNNIQILPASPMDDQIRRAEYRAIYGFPSLQRYAEGAIQPIHIIVDMGHVTLEGMVANEADRDAANIRANGVPGVFSVTNHLRLDRQS